MKELFIFLSFSFVLIQSTSCKKSKERNQFSDWKINGTEYRSNNVTIITTKGAAVMECRESEGFSLVWFTSTGFPSKHERLWRIVDGAQNTIGVNIYYQGNNYMISSNEESFVQSRFNNSKVEFPLSSTWFINQNNLADSILVEGIFREP